MYCTTIGPERLEATDTDAPAIAPCPICGSSQPRISMHREGSGEWKVVFCGGHFELTWLADCQVAIRILILFLRGMRTVTSTAKRPFLRQEWLASCFSTCQERISRYEKYYRERRWHALLSEYLPLVLTPGLCEKVLDEWVPRFWLTAGQVQERLRAAGTVVSREAVAEVARGSGFAQVRQRLHQMAPFQDKGYELGEDWLVGRLCGLVDDLLGRLQRGESVPTQTVIELQSLREKVGRPVQTKSRVQPWQARVDQWFSGTWEAGPEDGVRCPHCHSGKVGRKSGKPRQKTYLGDDGEMHQVPVYRYYCKDSRCPFQTFTDLPQGLLPHTPFGMVARLFALGVYMGYRTSYRRAGWAVGLAGKTMYRWVHYWAQRPALFFLLNGQIRTSGVIAVDEKWVKVRPEKRREPHGHAVWMYAYFAVDVHTYDLLHTVLSPVNDEKAARVFLLELKAKGYEPRAIVTDLRLDYGKVLHAVFPRAVQHECIFHALEFVI